MPPTFFIFKQDGHWCEILAVTGDEAKRYGHAVTPEAARRIVALLNAAAGLGDTIFTNGGRVVVNHEPQAQYVPDPEAIAQEP